MVAHSPLAAIGFSFKHWGDMMHSATDVRSAAIDWSDFAAHHRRIRSPLRPSPQDVSNFQYAIRGNDSRVLLLGVTPELSGLGQNLVAADGSPRMIEQVWPGDDDNRRAILADWQSLPFGASSFHAVVGDGSLNVVADGLAALLLEIKRVLMPSGVAAFRTFCSPEIPESLDCIADDVRGGWSGNFHALKWRIAMAAAARQGSCTIPVEEIKKAFEDMFADRNALCEITGWSMSDIATIDYYDVAGYRLGFPSERNMREIARQCGFSISITQSTGYPLADRCPIIVLSPTD